MRLFYDMMLVGISVQLAAYVLWAFNIYGAMGIGYPFGNAPQQLSTLQGWFDLSVYNALLGIGGAAVIGVAALLLRQGTYALYAMLIFAIGMFIPIVKNFVLAVPNTVAALLPVETNPTPGLINPIQLVIGLMVLFAGFIFIFEMVIQRNIS